MPYEEKNNRYKYVNSAGLITIYELKQQLFIFILYFYHIAFLFIKTIYVVSSSNIEKNIIYGV